MNTYTGKVVVLRDMQSNRVSIRVEDEPSGCCAVEIELTSETFADALFSRYTPCTFEMNESGVIGAIHEHKTELVPFEMFGHADARTPEAEKNEYRTPAAVKALAPFEVDGWHGQARDLFNGHNRIGSGKSALQRVVFRRYLRDGKPI